MLPFSFIEFQQRPYRYLLFLSDFIRHRPFTIIQSGQQVVFDYIGDSSKFYTPDSFSNYFDVSEAISWLRKTNFQLKAGTTVYTLEHIDMPDDYIQGINGQLSDALKGIAVLQGLLENEYVRPNDVIDRALNLKYENIQRRTFYISKNKQLNLEIKLYDSIIPILRDPKLLYSAMSDVKKACNYVNFENVSNNLKRLNNLDGYRLKLVIGNNRAIIRHDVKLFQQIRGTYKEINLESRH